MTEHQPRPSRDPALALLRWMELCGLKLDHAKLAKAHAQDAWWAASGEEITGPHRFSEVLLALREGASPLQIVHESAAGEETPPWRTLRYSPLWRKPAAVALWRAVFNVVGTLLAFVVIGGILPRALRPWFGAAFPPAVALALLWQFHGSLRPVLQPMALGAARLWRRSFALRRGFGKAAVLLLAAAALFALCRAFDWTPQRLLEQGRGGWARLSASFAPGRAAQPAAASQESSASAPAPDTGVDAAAQPATIQPGAPVAAEPMAEPAQAAQPAAREEQALNLEALSRSPAQWPKAVALAQARKWPAVLGGKVVGTIELKAGTMLKLLAVRGGQVVAEYMGAQQTIPAEATDLLQQVKTTGRRTALPSSPLAVAAARSPMQPPPAAVRAPLPAAPVQEGSDSGLPGLAVQPASYFGAVR